MRSRHWQDAPEGVRDPRIDPQQGDEIEAVSPDGWDLRRWVNYRDATGVSFDWESGSGREGSGVHCKLETWVRWCEDNDARPPEAPHA